MPKCSRRALASPSFTCPSSRFTNTVSISITRSMCHATGLITVLAGTSTGTCCHLKVLTEQFIQHSRYLGLINPPDDQLLIQWIQSGIQGPHNEPLVKALQGHAQLVVLDDKVLELQFIANQEGTMLVVKHIDTILNCFAVHNGKMWELCLKLFTVIISFW